MTTQHTALTKELAAFKLLGFSDCCVLIIVYITANCGLFYLNGTGFDGGSVRQFKSGYTGYPG